MIANRHFSHIHQWQFAITFIALLVLVSPPAPAQAAWAAPTDIQSIIVRLADSDRVIRTKAAYELRLYGQNGQGLLIDAYYNGNATEKRGAMTGLTLLPQPRFAADTLILGLGDEDTATRSMAAHGLALIGSPVAPALVAMLTHDDQYASDAAAFSLKLMGIEAIPALIRGLTADKAYARAKAAWLLGRMGPEASSAIPALIQALNVDDIRAMHVVAEAIDLIGPEPNMAVYHLTLLGNPPVGCPVKQIGKQSAPILVRLLTRPGTPMAQLAFRALAEIGTPAAPALRAGIDNGPIGLKVACALLLVEIDPSATHTLPEEVLDELQNIKPRKKQ